MLPLALFVVALGQFAAGAEQGAPVSQQPTIRQLLEQLGHADKAQAAVDALIARGKEAVPLLGGEAIEGNDVTRRGWAIVALAEIGGKDVDELLTRVHSDPDQPMLVRTWAAAARVSMTDTAEGLIEKAPLVQEFPALGRPIGLRLLDRLGDAEQVTAESILSVSVRVPQLQQSLARAILAQGSVKLSSVMATARDQKVRYQAAAYLGTLAQQGDRGVSEAIITVYRFDPQAKDVPWKGGPLYVPGLQWGRDDSRALVGHLIAWHLWCDRHGRADEQRQIHNNLMSVSLAQAAGYQSPGFNPVATTQWLATWGKAVGREEIRRILKEQGVDSDSKYADVLQP